jgi:glycerol-3-phosphate dehydrogenase
VIDVEEISSITLYEREPLLRSGALCAVYIAGESIVDPLTLPLILFLHGKILGGHVQMNTEITNGKYDSENKYWTLNDGQFKSRIVINCAGLFGDVVEQIRINQQSSSVSTFTIQPRMGQFSVYSSPTSQPPIKSILLPMPTKFTKGIIVYPNLFNQIIVGPTAETQHDRSQAPIKSDVTEMLYDKVTELIPSFSKEKYEYIGSYTGIRPATEFSDYQIHSYNEFQWICCGGIRSTGLTSSLAIGEYVSEKLNDMINITHQLCCAGYSSERYYRSLEQLKAMFTLTSIGLQPNMVVSESKLSLPLTGNIQLGDDVKSSNLRINCNGEFYDISHSLLKLAWTTENSSTVDSQL